LVSTKGLVCGKQRSLSYWGAFSQENTIQPFIPDSNIFFSFCLLFQLSVSKGNINTGKKKKTFNKKNICKACDMPLLF